MAALIFLFFLISSIPKFHNKILKRLVNSGFEYDNGIMN